MLDDFILGSPGPAANDVGCSRGLLDSEGVFANIFPPDVLDGARTQAVDAFALLCSDDDILDRTARLDEEDCIRVTTFTLASAGR